MQNTKNLIIYIISKIAFVFLIVLTLDIGLLGSGNLIRFNICSLSISSRMIIFSITFLLLSIVSIIKNGNCLFKKRESYLFIFIIILLTYGLILGSINNPLEHVIHDLKKYLTLFILPPLILSDILNKRRVKIIKDILIISSTLISLFSLFVFFSSNFINENVYTFFKEFLPKYELIKRQNGGGIYMPSQITVFLVLIAQIYFIFFESKKGVYIYTTTILNLMCILQTSTRSFLYILYPYLIFAFINSFFKSVRRNEKSIFLIPFCMIFFSLALMNYFNVNIRMFSMNEPGSGKRESYILEILNNVSLFGKGYGSSLSSVGYSDLEIPLLEILYEYGVLGFILWGLFFVFVYFEITKRKFLNKYFIILSALLIASLANPYLFTPMGWFALTLCYSFTNLSSCD